jgi:Flp pilus assembly protein CpaB
MTAIEGPRRTKGRPLPNGRAVVGALLMSVAAVGVLAALRSAGDPSGRPIVVAAADLPIGHRLEATDLRVQRGELPDAARGAGFDTAAAVVGAVTVAPLRAGDVVQRSAVLAPDQQPVDGTGGRAFSFSVERERALDGALQRGERVDVLATYGTGDSAFTNVVARDVTIDDTDAGGRANSIGANTKITFTVALANGDDVLRLAHATQVAAITLVRTSQSEGSDPGRLDTFRTPTAGRGSSDTASTASHDERGGG